LQRNSGEPQKLWRWCRRSSITADSAARHILFGGGGVAHSQLAAVTEFSGSGVYSQPREAIYKVAINEV